MLRNKKSRLSSRAKITILLCLTLVVLIFSLTIINRIMVANSDYLIHKIHVARQTTLHTQDI